MIDDFDSAAADGPEWDSPGTSLEPGDMTREEFLALGNSEEDADFYYGEDEA
ncbi:hypothetical protein ACSDR0_24600 [Streptosporangium sp. G11]|uniref:hypothetical protein n=1 Tax=Streptosporangium sp. G11 TaxID=3436926 RepID=UPI003EB6AEF4